MIRLARPEDAAQIQAIYAPVVEATAISFETVPPSVEDMEDRIAATQPVWPWLVDDTGGLLRGYAYAGQHRTRAAYRWSVDVTVYVAAQARRTGVGQGLYRVLREILRAQGYGQAFAGIALPNPGSVALHEAAGFRHLGTYRRVGHKLGRWHDAGWWQLDLGQTGDDPSEPVPLDHLHLPEFWV